MKAIEYQQKYVKIISDQAKQYLDDKYRDTSTIVFKAPTGSGKTYMISQSLNQIVKQKTPDQFFSFFWISVNTLHEQSREKLIKYFADERLLECITIDDIKNNTIEENEIVFVNWDSLIKVNNVFRMDNEKDWNLASVVENTKEAGRQIILIIDESHRTASASKAKEVIMEISPVLTIEMTATPTEIGGALIEIPLKEIIAEGIIKKEIHINLQAETTSTNKDLLSLALNKRLELRKAYEKLGKKINPLLLIQIPNKTSQDTTNPEEYIIGLLAKHKITLENGKLAIWLSEIKENREFVEKPYSDVDVLVFKEAIAVGWDCPRAAILYLQREWNTERYVFNIQTLGRIMRMPEQMHYADNPDLNIGYVYTASDNFKIVEELAAGYATNLFLRRDENIYKPTKLVSEFIRRKRELTRLSSDFKSCLFAAANEIGLQSTINIHVTEIQQQIGVNGKVEGIDKPQQVGFGSTHTIKKDIKGIIDNYSKFCADMATPYAKARSSLIIKSSIRSLFKEMFEVKNEDEVAVIVMHEINNPAIRQLIDVAKSKYEQIPIREEEIISDDSWEIPKEISLYSDTSILETSNKSIIKNQEKKKLYVKKNKNGKIELSVPEIKFIEGLEQTDSDVLWWFKNAYGESKYFSIAYKRNGNRLYGFYPDFIIRTKKEILIIEIKDNNDFKIDSSQKLQAGKDYVKRHFQDTNVKFWIISPQDYFEFFKCLKDQTLDEFHSLYERNLIKHNISQKIVIGDKAEKSKTEQESLEFYNEFEKTLKEYDLLKEYAVELEQSLKQAQATVKALTQYGPKQDSEGEEYIKIDVPIPFNICVLGEVSEGQEIQKALNDFFLRVGIEPTQWSVDFYDNKKIKNSKLLQSMIRGQSKYQLIVTGQIHSHTSQGNKKGNILSELKNPKYIDHVVGCKPQDLLTKDNLISAVYKYIRLEDSDE